MVAWQSVWNVVRRVAAADWSSKTRSARRDRSARWEHRSARWEQSNEQSNKESSNNGWLGGGWLGRLTPNNRWSAVALLIVVMVTTAGCTKSYEERDLPENNTQLPGTELFGVGDRFNPNENASIVIIGIRSDAVLDTNSVTALWQQYDPTRSKLVREGSSITLRYSGNDQQRSVNRVLYYVFRVRPGYYVLQNATTTFRSAGFSVLDAGEIIHPSSLVLVRRKNYGVDYYDRLYVPFGRGRAELNRDQILDDLLSATVSHRFYVNPGDLVYLGNFVIGKNAPWVNAVERDDNAVRKLLRSYPELSGQLVFRDSLVPTNIRCEFSDENKGLEELRELVVQSRVTPSTLSNLGCSNGVRPPLIENTDVIVEPTIDYDTPLTPAETRR